MPFRNRTIAREMGAAFAVLAIYVLTLLAPLHQAAGLQRDLASIGFATDSGWSICAPLAQDADGNKTTVAVKCAASGIAKNELAAVEPAVLHVGIIRIGAVIAYAPRLAPDAFALPAHIGQARAPPATA